MEYGFRAMKAALGHGVAYVTETCTVVAPWSYPGRRHPIRPMPGDCCCTRLQYNAVQRWSASSASAELPLNAYTDAGTEQEP